MKKDKFKTKVMFLIEQPLNDFEPSVFAVFPKIHAYHRAHRDYKNTFLCYAAIGQHSAVHTEYYKNCSPATPDQYKDLAAELESIGYNLEILTNL